MKHLIIELKKNQVLFQQLFNALDKDFILWKKDSQSWSYLEILCHLLDEEREDFRLRLQSLWNDPLKDFIPINPSEWPVLRAYQSQNFDEKLEEFMEERTKSIQFLEELDSEDSNWENTKEHSSLGSLTPLFYLNNWLAHDYLHIRQLVRLRYDYLASISKHAIDYAGNWK